MCYGGRSVARVDNEMRGPPNRKNILYLACEYILRTIIMNDDYGHSKTHSRSSLFVFLPPHKILFPSRLLVFISIKKIYWVRYFSCVSCDREGSKIIRLNQKVVTFVPPHTQGGVSHWSGKRYAAEEETKGCYSREKVLYWYSFAATHSFTLPPLRPTTTILIRLIPHSWRRQQRRRRHLQPGQTIDNP